MYVQKCEDRMYEPLTSCYGSKKRIIFHSNPGGQVLTHRWASLLDIHEVVGYVLALGPLICGIDNWCVLSVPALAHSEMGLNSTRSHKRTQWKLLCVQANTNLYTFFGKCIFQRGYDDFWGPCSLHPSAVAYTTTDVIHCETVVIMNFAIGNNWVQ